LVKITDDNRHALAKNKKICLYFPGQANAKYFGHVSIQDDNDKNLHRHKMGKGPMFLERPKNLLGGNYDTVEYYAIMPSVLEKS